MQSKGLVRFFLFALIAVCLYQYLLMIPTSRIESAADARAEEIAAKMPEGARYEAKKLARAAFLDSMSSESVLSIPLIKNFTYEELKKGQLAMGLDLKGGMSVLMQVDLRDFLFNLSKKNADAPFTLALNQAENRLKNEQKDFVTLFGEEWAKVSGGRKVADIFARNEALKNEINFETADQEVLRVLRTKANETVNETFNRLKKRIDKTGVVQPNVSLDAARDLVLVELPGIENPERARAVLTKAANLEFWETYRVVDPGILETVSAADGRLKAILSGDTSAAKVKVDSVPVYGTDANGNIDSQKVIGKRPVTVDPVGGQGGPLLSKLQLNSAGQLGLPVLGLADDNKRGLIFGFDDKGAETGYLARPEIKQMFPQDILFRWSDKPRNDPETGAPTRQYELYMLKKTRGKDEAPLSGEVVTNAFPQPDPQTGQVQVTLEMDNKGAKTWAELTTKAANDGNREIAVVLDNEVVSAPRVINPITGGTSSITGDYTVDEAKDFSNILEVGKLPAKTKIVQESQVGPSLGAENISKALTSMLIGLSLLCFFMIAYYAGGGWVSVIALLLNVFFILAALASMGTVLTLPGIAGILLVLAAAVDANVIIFERIREELRAGKEKMLAIREGFKRSLPAIIDANVTTFLTAAVLWVFGLGPIKGFGVVLMIGIVCSLFTAVLVGRLLTEWWIGRGGKMDYSRSWSENVLANVNIDWMGKRKYAYMFSAAITIVGIASFFVRGFELGVDFKGGNSYNVQFDKSIDQDALKASLDQSFGSGTIVKTINTQNAYNITTPFGKDLSGEGASDIVMGKLFEGVNNYAGKSLTLEAFKKTDGTGTHVTSSSQVGAVVADDIRNSSAKAALWALGLIFLYLLLRFRRWQFSMGAVIALFHDVLITLTFFTLLHGLVPFSLEIDQAIIACILTVMGFSVNDTVIVYDRLREYIATFAGMPKEEVFNRAINSTLSRTLITSGTIFLVVLVLFIFGGAGIRSFAFGMLVGTLFGTYSSIFVASALVVDLIKEKVITSTQTSRPTAPAATSFNEAPAQKARTSAKAK